MSRENTLNDSKTIVNSAQGENLTSQSREQSRDNFSLQDLMKALADTDAGHRPVERWNPSYCGEMDMVIKADGTWWHEGSQITRQPLIKLFASILRKDADGRTYLVTPVEKIAIQVERGHFIAMRVDARGSGQDQRLFFTTNLDEVIEAGPENPIHVQTNPETLEPSPFVTIRGRLEASISRSVFYELVELSTERAGETASQLGVYAGGVFFPLGPEGAHET